MMHEGFVDLAQAVQGIAVEARYATSHNLTGHPLAGYHANKALGCREMAAALKIAFDKAQSMGYGLLIYDAYRPQKAVQDFVKWSKEPENGETKAEFYPELTKADLFPMGYIAERSGHTRGSVVDLTLTRGGVPVDMGTGFDLMSDLSHQNCRAVTPEQWENRAVLRSIMAYAGFDLYYAEWWHFRLMEEPYPDTYFDFDID